MKSEPNQTKNWAINISKMPHQKKKKNGKKTEIKIFAYPDSA